MRVGAILFDSGDNIVGSDRTIISINSAWASIGGGQARRVQGISDLPSDVIWFTNLTYSNFYKAGLHKHPNFRNAEWLRTQFYQLVSELGVDINNQPPHITVSVIATIAQRVVNVAEAQFSLKPESSRKLNDDFARILGAPRSAIPNNIYSLFKPVCEHPSVSVIHSVNYGAASPSITLRRNRITHAREVMSTVVPPDSGWEMEPSVAPDGSDQWLEDIKQPFLVRCTVSEVKPMIAEVLSWGAGAKSPRLWLTDIEWRVVRQHGKVIVHQALICKNPAAPLPQGLCIPSSTGAELSITYGLIAENIWTALTNPQYYKGDETRFTAAAAWLRSADRMIMFNYAQKLYGRGIDVMSYGVGNVVLRYPEGGLNRILDVCLDIGLIPPASKVAEASKGVTA